MTNVEDPFANSLDHSSKASIDKDPVFQAQIQRLHHLTVYGRWSMIILLWICIAPISLWSLRSEIALWVDYFTWTAVRYTLIYNRLQAFGLSICIGMTIAVLIWQSRNILWGISTSQLRHLEKQVLKIRQQGKSHPLWQWVVSGRVKDEG
ncbi:MAG: hypothetical protein HC769_12125 [Cyanobacteria bacterium CRU_2_1]|nr:hypothetical protein [Cyanobacteria bacterium RU_5_0]NJR59523.1 hypothetical protein [Cyanobacteria bacterium CRU_2_1]